MELIVQPPLDPALKALAEETYKNDLENAESAFRKRLEENKCPGARMEDFNIRGQLASGAFATIFLVQHIKRKERYALKVQTKLGTTAFRIRIAIEEEKLLRALNSRFIVKLHFAFQDFKNHYMALEYASAGDLLMFQNYTFPDCYYKFFAAQIVLGLEYLHACKLVHRDIKPENVLVFSNNYLKLADFAFCQRCEDKITGLSGTVDYMAPDVFTPGGYGKAVDWWALGVTLYELRYKQHPYVTSAPSFMQCIVSATTITVTFPKTGDTAADEAFESLVGGLLEKNPSNRLGSREGGVKELKNHKWFDEIDFIDIYLGRTNINLNLRGMKTAKITRLENYDFLPGPDDKNPDPEKLEDF